MEGDATNTTCGRTSFLAVFKRLSRKWARKAGAMRYDDLYWYTML